MRARLHPVWAAGLVVAAMLALMPSPARAQVAVQVFKAAEEGMTPTALRQEAMKMGFAQAATEFAQRMLPCPLNETRTALLSSVIATRADHYVLSYRELSAAHSAEGFRLEMEVEVDRRQLRDDLAALGLDASCSQRLAFSLEPGEGMTDEDLQGLRDLVQLSGLTATPGVTPRLLMHRVGEDLLTGELATDQGSWAASGPDEASVWIELWGKYFARQEALRESAGGEVLMVSGWFTPDGAFEFDRVLAGWDQAVSEVRLVDVDVAPEGVSARWSIRIRDKARLSSLLDSWLAGKGLDHTLIGSEGR